MNTPPISPALGGLWYNIVMTTTRPAPKMTPRQALSLALLLLDFEIEQPQVSPPPQSWLEELQQARAALTELKATLTPARQMSPPGVVFVGPGRQARAQVAS